MSETPYSAAYDRVIYAAGLEKVAARIPVIHGTSGMWDTLKPAVGKTIAAVDPNPRAVYVATDRRSARPGVEAFARAAAEARNGTPYVAKATIDTQKGWVPHGLTSWARDRDLTYDDYIDILEDIDATPDKAARGELWEMVNRGVGAWKNVDRATEVTPRYYVPVDPA